MSRVLSEDLNNPDLFTENKAGEYEYAEDARGWKTASGSLAISDAPVRDPRAQQAAGGESRRESGHEWGADDGGHLIGARFGGEAGEENLTAQSRNLNRGSYKRMEDSWEKHLEAGDKVFVNVEAYGSGRPSSYMGYAIYEAPDGTRTFETFSYNNESKEEIARWENDFEEAEQQEYLAQLGQEQEDYTGSFDEESAAPEESGDYVGNLAESGVYAEGSGHAGENAETGQEAQAVSAECAME